MAPGFFRKLFKKIKDGAKKIWDGVIKPLVPKVLPTVADVIVPGSGQYVKPITDLFVGGSKSNNATSALQPLTKKVLR